jgi:hypothetical protein
VVIDTLQALKAQMNEKKKRKKENKIHFESSLANIALKI